MYFTKTVSSTPSMISLNGVWTIIAAVLAIVGGIALYFLFTSKKNKGEFKGFLAWLHSFLRFDKMLIESILKIVYLILALFITLSSFGIIGTSFLGFILELVLGNLILRVLFEFSILGIQLWKNTTEIKEEITERKKTK